MPAAALVASLCLLASCQGVGFEPAPPAKIAVQPGDGDMGWRPAKPLSIDVDRGELRDVSVTTADGKSVDGRLDAGKSRWVPRWPLHVDTRYRLTAVAVNSDGKKTTKTTSFTTVKPKSRLDIDSVYTANHTYGVGVPIVITFKDAVHNKARVERAMEVRTSKPVTGAWNWMSSTELHFRPKDLWRTGTKVHFIAHMNGVRAAKGSYGTDNVWTKFTIGPKHVTKINADTHQLKAYKRGKLVRTFPISAGDAANPSTSGTFVAMEALPHTTLTGPGYSVATDWNVRYTWSGQFVHSAPWSVGSQGYANVSHGCINASPTNAQWYYNFTNVGDIIKVTGTSRHADDEWGNGWTDWNKPFAEYLKGSATGKPVHTLRMNGEPR